MQNVFDIVFTMFLLYSNRVRIYDYFATCLIIRAWQDINKGRIKRNISNNIKEEIQ